MPAKPADFRRSQADARIRTADPFITSEVLYQLSYVGSDGEDSAPTESFAGRRDRYGRRGSLEPQSAAMAFRTLLAFFGSAVRPYESARTTTFSFRKYAKTCSFFN